MAACEVVSELVPKHKGMLRSIETKARLDALLGLGNTFNVMIFGFWGACSCLWASVHVDLYSTEGHLGQLVTTFCHSGLGVGRGRERAG